MFISDRFCYWKGNFGTLLLCEGSKNSSLVCCICFDIHPSKETGTSEFVSSSQRSQIVNRELVCKI